MATKCQLNKLKEISDATLQMMIDNKRGDNLVKTIKIIDVLYNAVLAIFTLQELEDEMNRRKGE